MFNEATYSRAIDYAQTLFDAFYDQHDRIEKAYKEGKGNDKLTLLMERDEQKLAAATCAQTEMISYLFGVSDEQVHEDLMRNREELREIA